MSGGGGKGGESTVRMDRNLSGSAKDALDRAARASKIPYSPNRGVTIAAFTPQQQAAMANASAAAEAFGMAGGNPAAMPATETNAMGIEGYSTGALYDEMRDKSLSPTLQAAIDKFFISRNGGTAGAQQGSAGGGGVIDLIKLLTNDYKEKNDSKVYAGAGK